MTYRNFKKTYVAVNLDVGIDGKIRPRLIRWEDGMVYEVNRVKDVRRAASTKVGGCGIRYTVSVCGKEAYLFNEDDRWFVEARGS